MHLQGLVNHRKPNKVQLIPHKKIELRANKHNLPKPLGLRHKANESNTYSTGAQLNPPAQTVRVRVKDDKIIFL